MGAADAVAPGAITGGRFRRMVGADGAGIPPAGEAAGGGRVIHLRQAWPRPTAARPSVFVGAGAIVRTAHLPAYTRLQFPIAGLFDLCRATADQTAQQFGGLHVFATLAAAAATADAIFDVALPGKEIAGVLAQLPHRSAVLIQK